MNPKPDINFSPLEVRDVMPPSEVAKLFDVSRRTVMDWGRMGFLTRYALPFAKGYVFDAREVSAKLIREGKKSDDSAVGCLDGCLERPVKAVPVRIRTDGENI